NQFKDNEMTKYHDNLGGTQRCNRLALIGNSSSTMIKFRGDLIKHLIEIGIEVYTLISEYTDEDLKQLSRIGATPIPYQMSRSGTNPLSDIFGLISLKKKIRKIQPDVVLSFFAKPVIYGT